MTGITGNIYCGLHEFMEMGFTLHLLRKNDLFVDIGANVGSYTILAGTTQSNCITIEPIPQTYKYLIQNIALNKNTQKGEIKCLNIGLGPKESNLSFIADQNCYNRVISETEIYNGRTINVKIKTLDSVINEENFTNPVLIKLDTEGFEYNILKGAAETLKQKSLLAIICELDSKTDNNVNDLLSKYGFEKFSYDPFSRELIPFNDKEKSNNIIFVKEINIVKKILKTAPKFKILGKEI